MAAPDAAAPPHDELMRRARQIAARASERGDETERERRVPEETLQELRDADLLRVCQPGRWGGFDRPWSEVYELIYTLARGCGSTGWVYCVLAAHARAIGGFPIEAQEEVWGADPGTLASSAFFPSGQAARVDGGYRLSGGFPFSSGCDHARWAIVGAFAAGGEAPPAPQLFLVPLGEMTIVDDWRTLGLVGTGSKTLLADDLFVPSHRAIPMPMFAGGVLPFALQSAMVGAAQGGVDVFIEQTRTKVPRFGPPPAESDHHQILVGESWGESMAAWDLLARAVARCAAGEGPDGTLPPEVMLRNRADNALISRLCVSAIERVYELSGGHGVYWGPLTRALRDVRTAAQHAAINTHVAAKDAGLSLLRPGGAWSGR